MFRLFWYCFCPTKHHTGYEFANSLWPYPLDRTARNLPSLKRSTTRISCTIFGVTTDRCTILQHVDDPDVIDSPGPAQPQIPLPTDNPDEGLGTPDSDDNSLPFLGDPEPEFFGETTPPSISLIGRLPF